MKREDTMDCERVQEDVSAWIDRELDDKGSRALFAHLAECAVCRKFLDNSMSIRSALAATVPSIPAPVFALNATPAASASDSTPATHWWNRVIPIPLPVAASLLLVLASAIALSLTTLTGIRSMGQHAPQDVIYIMDITPVEIVGQSPARAQ